MKVREDITKAWFSHNVPTEWIQNNPGQYKKYVESFQKVDRPKSGIMAQLKALSRFNSTESLSQIQVPCLMIHGDKDEVMPIANSHSLNNLIPNSKLYVIKDAGHMFWLSHLQETSQVVSTFVNDVNESSQTKQKQKSNL